MLSSFLRQGKFWSHSGEKRPFPLICLRVAHEAWDLVYIIWGLHPTAIHAACAFDVCVPESCTALVAIQEKFHLYMPQKEKRTTEISHFFSFHLILERGTVLLQVYSIMSVCVKHELALGKEVWDESWLMRMWSALLDWNVLMVFKHLYTYFILPVTWRLSWKPTTFILITRLRLLMINY